MKARVVNMDGLLAIIPKSACSCQLRLAYVVATRRN